MPRHSGNTQPKRAPKKASAASTQNVASENQDDQPAPNGGRKGARPVAKAPTKTVAAKKATPAKASRRAAK